MKYLFFKDYKKDKEGVGSNLGNANITRILNGEMYLES